jgi:hypothetical protein
LVFKAIVHEYDVLLEKKVDSDLYNAIIANGVRSLRYRKRLRKTCQYCNLLVAILTSGSDLVKNRWR